VYRPLLVAAGGVPAGLTEVGDGGGLGEGGVAGLEAVTASKRSSRLSVCKSNRFVRGRCSLETRPDASFNSPVASEDGCVLKTTWREKHTDGGRLGRKKPPQLPPTERRSRVEQKRERSTGGGTRTP
jgi:hypothetical protein